MLRSRLRLETLLVGLQRRRLQRVLDEIGHRERAGLGLQLLRRNLVKIEEVTRSVNARSIPAVYAGSLAFAVDNRVIDYRIVFGCRIV